VLIFNCSQERDEDVHRLYGRRHYEKSGNSTERGRRSKLTYDKVTSNYIAGTKYTCQSKVD